MNRLLLFRVLHLAGIFMLLSSIGALIVVQGVGAAAQKYRRIAYMVNGIGLLLTLIAGFALVPIAVGGFPLWVILKMFIWLAFGFLIVAIKRRPESGNALWMIGLALAVFAAYLAQFKPF